MPSFDSARRTRVITIRWAVAWGLAGVGSGWFMTILQPDTGHVPRGLVLLMITLPSMLFGGSAGVIFAMLTRPCQTTPIASAKRRVVLGGTVSGAVGVVFMVLWAHSIVTLILSTILGVGLAAWSDPAVEAGVSREANSAPSNKAGDS